LRSEKLAEIAPRVRAYELRARGRALRCRAGLTHERVREFAPRWSQGSGFVHNWRLFQILGESPVRVVRTLESAKPMPIWMGKILKVGPKRPTRLFGACLSTCAVFASSFGAVRAADMTSSQAAPATDAPNSFTGWYVKLGAMGVLDRSSSNLYQQSIAGMIVPGIGTVPVGVGPQFQIPGLGASYSNFAGVSFEGGYAFTPNWSVEVASGFPLWATVTVNGSSPTGPPSGTILSKLLPASVPITGVYHFTQFGSFQPYVGAGVATTFALAVRDGYSTGSTYQPALGVVVQGGFDYMLNKHWGVFVDAKQGFVGTTGNSTGVNTAPSLGPIAGTIRTNARPVAFTTGFTYHF
jgi:outer membrane protein